jgi:hypothetical protein
MGRLRQGPIRRAFAGRRTSGSSGSRGGSQGTVRHTPQSPSRPPSSSSSNATKGTQANSTTRPPHAANSGDTGVAAGTSARAGGETEEKAAQAKANNVLGNMFSDESSKEKKGGGFSAGDLTSGLSKLFSGDGIKALTGATKSFEFSDEERKKAEAGLGALKKMAGKDGVLTPSDRENIIGQMNTALTAEKNKTVNSIANQKIQEAKNNRGPLRKALFPRAPLVSSVGAKRKAQALNDPQHMNTARNTALGQLNQGFKDMGMDTKEPVSFNRGLNAAQNLPPIGLNDTDAFKDTMLMVQEKAKSMGLPEGQFKKGLPVGFLEDVLGGKPAASLLKHQVNPFGK